MRAKDLGLASCHTCGLLLKLPARGHVHCPRCGSVVHLRNMLTLAEAGAVVLPAMPGFYHRPQRVEDLVDFVVARVLDALGVEHALVRRWATPRPVPGTAPWDEGEV